MIEIIAAHILVKEIASEILAASTEKLETNPPHDQHA